MKPASTLIVCLLVGLWAHTANSTDPQKPVWWESAANEARENGYRLITPKELYPLIDSDSALLLDVRADYEYESGHIPGALNLAFDLGDRMQLSPAKETLFLELLGQDKNRTIIIYCRSFQ